MAYYEYPNATDSESFGNVMGYINRTADGLFFPIILLVIWFISFITILSNEGQGRAGAAKAFTFSSFLTSILSMMLVLLNFMAVKFLYMQFIFVAVGVIWLKMEQN